MSKCILCGKEIKGYGNNAAPLADGVCCDACNEVVVAHRFGLVRYEKLSDNDKANIKRFFEQNRPDAKIGARVLIYEMKGEPNYSGKSGVIQHIDGIGQLHGTWGGCALSPKDDTYVILSLGEHA